MGAGGLEQGGRGYLDKGKASATFVEKDDTESWEILIESKRTEALMKAKFRRRIHAAKTIFIAFEAQFLHLFSKQ